MSLHLSSGACSGTRLSLPVAQDVERHTSCGALSWSVESPCGVSSGLKSPCGVSSGGHVAWPSCEIAVGRSFGIQMT